MTYRRTRAPVMVSLHRPPPVRSTRSAKSNPTTLREVVSPKNRREWMQQQSKVDFNIYLISRIATIAPIFVNIKLFVTLNYSMYPYCTLGSWLCCNYSQDKTLDLFQDRAFLFSTYAVIAFDFSFIFSLNLIDVIEAR